MRGGWGVGKIGKLRWTDRESERWQSRGKGERRAEEDRTKKKSGGRATERLRNVETMKVVHEDD